MEKTIYERYASQINNLQAPGIPNNKVAIFVGKEVFTENGKYTLGVRKINEGPDYYINTTLIPWAFMNGIYCKGMTHGNFVVERCYDKVTNIPNKKEEDYSLNVDVLNYVNAVMVATNLYNKEIVSHITMVYYIGEADVCGVREFKDEEEFTKAIEEELEYLEEE